MEPTKSNQTKHFAAKEKGLREACFAHGGEAHVGEAIRSGMVRGPGGPREDKIPARLSNGEYVLPADVVKKIGRKNLDDMLEAHHVPHLDRDGDGDASMSVEGDTTMQAMKGGLRFSDGGEMILPIDSTTPITPTAAATDRRRPIVRRAHGGVIAPPLQVPVLLADGGFVPTNGGPGRIVRPVIKDQSPLLSPMRSMMSEMEEPFRLAEGGSVSPLEPKTPTPASTPASAPAASGGRFLRGALSVPGAAAASTMASAADSFDTPTDNYARRLGVDRAPGDFSRGADTVLRSMPVVGAAYNAAFPDREAASGMISDLPIRAAGVVSDAGADILDMGTSAVNAGLRASGSNKQLTPFKTILQAQDEPGKPAPTPYTTLPSRPAPQPTFASTGAVSTGAPVGGAPLAPREPLPGEFGGGLKVVDKKDAEGNIIHRTITGEGAKGEGLRAPTTGVSYSDRRLAPLSAPRVRYGAQSGSNFPGADPFQSGRMARGIQRQQDNIYAGLNNQRDIAEMRATSEEGIARANMESRERIERAQAESQAVGRAAQAEREGAKSRQDAENHMTKQLESIFVTQDKEGKVIPDTAKVADFKQHIAPTIASEIKKLESIPADNPAYNAARARASKLRSMGQVDVNDPQFAKYVAAYNLKQRIKDSSGLMYGKASYRDSNDLNDFMNPTVRESAVGQKRYVFANGAELPVNDAAYADGPANYVLPDAFKTPTSQFKPVLGIRQ